MRGLGLVFGLVLAGCAWGDSHAWGIAESHIEALNSKDAATIHKWVQAYCARSLQGSLEPKMLKIGQTSGHRLNKIVFDAPYEFIAEVYDSKYGVEHLTVCLSPRGKVRSITLFGDR